MNYKISPPLGTTIIPKEVMTENELRSFLSQIIGDHESAEVWNEKAAKDPIENLVEWLKRAGYEIEEIK